MSFWKRGQFSEIVGLTGISKSHLSDIFHRRRGVSWERAIAISTAAWRCGLDIPTAALANNRTTRHPAFSKLED